MMHLSISEILLISQKEKKARSVTFDPKRTVIQGKNHTGKSCLIKSIYRTFGAEVTLHPKFKAANATTLVKFTIAGLQYQILRDDNQYAIFDGNGQFIRKFTSVSKQLGPYLSNLFNFRPLFQNKKNEYVTPTPAILFLPYYVDQDKSWMKSWSAFKSLEQFKDYRNQSIRYHSGLRANEYYQTRKELAQYLQAIEELDKEQKVTNKILSQVKDKLGQAEFNMDVEDFKEEIKELLVESDKLKQKEETLKHTLLEFYNIKAIIESQLEIIKRAILENHKDLSFASEELEAMVDCPVCGAHYENSFTERFAIANDEQRSKDLMIELSKELEVINGKIAEENNKLLKTTAEVERIEAILSQKKGAIVFKDIIEHSGKKQVKELFQERVDMLIAQIKDNAIKKDDLQKTLKALEDRKRTANITEKFQDYLTLYLKKLDVQTLSRDDYKTLQTKIEERETGSALPRALIAYYYSFFNLMRDFSTTTFCPLLIDAPNQGDQDIKHIDDIMKFINENQPKDTQMILGISEDFGVNFNCKVELLTEPYSLLNEQQYDAVLSEMQPKLEKLWFSI